MSLMAPALAGMQLQQGVDQMPVAAIGVPIERPSASVRLSQLAEPKLLAQSIRPASVGATRFLKHLHDITGGPPAGH